MKLDRDDIPKHHLRNSFFDKPETKNVDGFTIFIAVLAAISVAFFLRAAYNEWQLRQAVEMFSQRLVATQKHNQQRIEVNKKEREEQAFQQKMAKYRVEQSKQAAISAGIQERKAKVEAWENFYKPIKGCESTNDDKDLIKCGNDHLRAKAKFEKLWASGQLR
ncbi:MAG: hypothetical protein ACI9T7_003498 [Oleiphilaceae bacterium]|jgi:hypothetical protein